MFDGPLRRQTRPPQINIKNYSNYNLGENVIGKKALVEILLKNDAFALDEWRDGLLANTRCGTWRGWNFDKLARNLEMIR